MEQLSLDKLIAVAELFRKANKLEKCEVILRRAMELHPQQVMPALCLAKLILQRANEETSRLADDALDVLTTALDYSHASSMRDHAEAYAFITGLLLKIKRPDDALVWCHRAIAANHGDSRCSYNMNVALRQLNRIDAALEHTLATLRDQHGIVIDDTVRKHHDRRLHTDHTTVGSSEGLCIVLVKYGTKYGPEYVNRLAYGLYRHHNKSIVPKLRVICFTDDIRGIDKSIIECRGLGGDSEMAGWSGWWYKACIFSSAANLPAGRIAYIDLDTIVVGDWSFLAMVPTNSSNSLAVCEPDVFLVLSAKSLSNTEGRLCGFNSSVLVWTEYRSSYDSSEGGTAISLSTSRFHFIYEILCAHFAAITSILYKFDHFLELIFIKVVTPVEFAYLDDFSPGKVMDYLSTTAPSDLTPAEGCNISVDTARIQINDDRSSRDCHGFSAAAFVTFPIKPKPHEIVSSVPWVQACWSDDV